MNQPEVESVEVEKAPDLPRRRMTVFALVAIAFWTAVADWLIYRTYGYAGPALFFVIAPILILASHWKNAECEPARSRRIWLSVLFVTIAMACLRLVIAGHGGLFVALILLTLAFGLAASGSVPWAAETLMMMFWLPFDGLGWFAKHRLPRLHSAQSDRVSMGATLSWLLPMIAVLVFGSLFVLANPDLLGQVSTLWGWAIDWTWSWAQRLDAWEIPFCVAALILGTGLFFPSLGRTLIGGVDQQSAHQASSPSSMYQPFRNMLVCLIGLFIVYLTFEFQTLYRSDFPDGFYYAGYAHEGAAWLTVALALATGTLSVVFRGGILLDDRLSRLKQLAWMWSGLNFLLAISVYNRLMIYVGYNGLTWMRIVGFFGITIVVVGFVLVLVKIASRRGFWWLLRSQSTAFVAGLILLAIFPSDWITHRYNSARVLAGYNHPAVMVAVKDMDELGYLAILPLVDAEDPIIREGVRAMLAERQLQIEREFESVEWHWTMFQWSTDMLYERLVELEPKLAHHLRVGPDRESAIREFKSYSMRWY